MLPADVQDWADGGRFLTTPSGRIFVRSAPGAGPTLLLLHGFPSSSFDYRRVVDELAGQSWLTLDFLGFGLSDKPRWAGAHRPGRRRSPRVYSLLEQADIVEDVLAQTTTGPVVVVAHDMGTSVATELLARDVEGRLTFDLRAAVLTNGSVILERASLRPSQKVLRGPLGPLLSRLTSRAAFIRGFARLFSSAHPLTADEAEAQWALLAHNDGHRIMHLLCAYLDERVRYASRWHGAIAAWTKPLSYLWGLQDPVATVNVLVGLRDLRPAADVVELPDVGHYPQVEVPSEFAVQVRDLLSLH
ncbi:alpha/beta fold hydrolase [Mycolicibacterium neoaurum]|uniref:alpha/beta fold hydrolase n=1 Tax=Mycolicibacterium neoaurum TaxID=1795 RepID=UPI00055D67DE|nr:alpha/beta hydrolase [Mycolicibacterium neoaurum]